MTKLRFLGKEFFHSCCDAPKMALSLPKANKTRLIQLDVLRGFAILLVLGRHPPVPGSDAGLFTPLAYWWQSIGWSGVDLFFVLSGFLIGGLLLKELQTYQTIDFLRFYTRRCLRIWPAYYVCMGAAFCLVLARSHGNIAEAVQIMWPNLLHIQNYVLDARRPVGQSWTLAVEEHFYLVLPLFLWLIWRLRKKKSTTLLLIPFTAFFLCLVCGVFRLTGFYNSNTNFFATHLRADSLFWGVFLAYLFHFEPQKLNFLARNRPLLLLVGAILLSPMVFLDRGDSAFMRSGGITFLSWGYGCLLLAAVYTPLDQGLAGKLLSSSLARFIAWIGIHSYTIYLWFGILGAKPTEAIFRQLPPLSPNLNWLCQFVTYLVLSILGGVIMAKVVDYPILKLRDRRFPARATILPHSVDSMSQASTKS